ncbi:hypothetical protein AFL01nite_02660 [Aeromicrobium flavum]|uniref:McrBC 5-methylcytosine restriction system component n=1 Tax=Aeromicrobium flavum TaxID=416568 RepID=A0A512HR60_9ACTN|nr:hypothetical protein [Aeromicrobium flavum]GEO87939.1 hypothetical protein AFL01nite_02660 [Aeromicrobium flavum]
MERLLLEELRERPGTTGEVAALSGRSEGEILIELRELNDRLKALLGYKDDPIVSTASGAWKTEGIAGLLRFNSGIELEVVPKFMDRSSNGWRSDFFLLAVLVRTGHLLIHDEISAGTQDRGDLATLIARSLLNLHAQNERRPIRSYRRTRSSDFAIDGDVEWESLVLPDPDGFEQSRLELTRRNPYNGTLAAAVRTLLPEVADADTQEQLRLLGRRLAPQSSAPETYPPLPARHRSWQQAYDLARLVVEGLGLNLDGGSFTGTGFLLSTWSAWQSLCEEVVRRALPDRRVISQKRWVLGYRGDQPVYATPDISPLSEAEPTLLLDAKYKTRTGRTPSISAADVYESLAFLRASGATTLKLLYPALSGVDRLPLGEWTAFDEVTVDDLTITAYEVQVRGLASSGGFDHLVEGARKALLPSLAGA